MLTANLNQETNTLHCQFKGRFDGLKTKEVAPLLNEKIAEATETAEGINITFDLTNVDYIASAFIGLCIAVAKKVGEKHFSITNTNPLLKKTFKIAGLEEALNVS